MTSNRKTGTLQAVVVGNKALCTFYPRVPVFTASLCLLTADLELSSSYIFLSTMAEY